MGKPWATLGFDLRVELIGPGRRKGLTKALREVVRSGRLAPGSRLSSSRSLAAGLGIARTRVADAFANGLESPVGGDVKVGAWTATRSTRSVNWPGGPV